MKKMKNTLIISVLCGMLFALPVWIIAKIYAFKFAFLISIFSGLLFYLLLFVFLYFYMKYKGKAYAKAEKCIKSKVWYKINGNFKTSSCVRNANIYFTDSGLVFISLDKKPYLIDEIPLQVIANYQTDFLINLHITTKDNRYYTIMSSEIKTIFPLLKEHGWID